jgi:hypothetical protein
VSETGLAPWLRQRIRERLFLATRTVELGSFAQWEERSSGVLVTGDGDDSDPRCTVCNGEVWVECDDPIQCCDPRCDGELHPDPACGGTGLYEHQVIF